MCGSCCCKPKPCTYEFSIRDWVPPVLSFRPAEPEPAGIPVNLFFALDSSRSSVLGQGDFTTHPFEHNDLNGDGQVGSHFDAMLGVLRDALPAFAIALGNVSDVRLGVCAFEGDQSAELLTDGTTTLFDTSIDLSAVLGSYTGAPSFGNRVPLEENGTAYFAPALEASNTFFAANARTDANDILFVLTESLGTDTVGADTPFINALGVMLNAAKRPSVQVVSFDGTAPTPPSVVSTIELISLGPPPEETLGDGVIPTITDQAAKDAFIADVAAQATALAAS